VLRAVSSHGAAQAPRETGRPRIACKAQTRCRAARRRRSCWEGRRREGAQGGRAGAHRPTGAVDTRAAVTEQSSRLDGGAATPIYDSKLSRTKSTQILLIWFCNET
jgi:hypothetical protein